MAREGINKFKIIPVKPGEGVIRFDVNTPDGVSTLTVPGVRVFDGKAVSTGQTLLVLDSGTAGSSDLSVQFAQAESDYLLAQAEYERRQSLAADKIVSEAELQKSKANYEQAKALYDNLSSYTSSGSMSVKVTSAGYVCRLYVRNGQFVEAGAPLLSIVRNRDILLKAQLQPHYYPALSEVTSAAVILPGADGAVTLESLGGKMLSYGRSVDAPPSAYPCHLLGEPRQQACPRNLRGDVSPYV